MNIAGYNFSGPYLTSADFSQVGAVYVISDAKNIAIDVGQTDNLRDRIYNHERKNCWTQNANGAVYVYAFVENNEKNRLAIESIIRNGTKFSCGVF